MKDLNKVLEVMKNGSTELNMKPILDVVMDLKEGSEGSSHLIEHYTETYYDELSKLVGKDIYEVVVYDGNDYTEMIKELSNSKPEEFKYNNQKFSSMSDIFEEEINEVVNDNWNSLKDIDKETCEMVATSPCEDECTNYWEHKDHDVIRDKNVDALKEILCDIKVVLDEVAGSSVFFDILEDLIDWDEVLYNYVDKCISNMACDLYNIRGSYASTIKDENIIKSYEDSELEFPTVTFECLDSNIDRYYDSSKDPYLINVFKDTFPSVIDFVEYCKENNSNWRLITL